MTPNIANAVALLDKIDKAESDSPVVKTLHAFVTELNNNPEVYNNPAIVEEAISQLIGESLLEVHSAISDVAVKAQGLVFGRLDNIRTIGATPPSAGVDDPHNHLWVGGFGSWAKQKEHDQNAGYTYNSWGFSLGYDRGLAAVDGLLFGINATFAYGKLDADNGRTKVDIDTIGFSGYGSYTYDNRFFVDATASFARSKSKYDENLILGGRKSGSFKTNTYQFGLRTGYIFDSGVLAITPSVGVRYTKFNQGGFTEQVSGTTLYPANVYDKVTSSMVEIPLSIKFDGSFETASVIVTPELRLGWTAMVKRPDNTFSVGFEGSPYRAQLTGGRPPRNSFNGGVGLKIETRNNLEFFVEYDANISRHFTDHRVSGGFGVYF
jgi:outer membrane autotransporter protein